MKKIFICIIYISLFILMLTHPVIVLNGVKQGISLWIESVVPSLLPYMILSNFLKYAGAYETGYKGRTYIIKGA